MRLVALLGFCLVACAQVEQPVPQFDPLRHARLRVFRNANTHLYLGDVCEGPVTAINHGSSVLFSFLEPNRTIGMPITATMPYRSYHEYVIPAGEPFTIKTYWQTQNSNGTWSHCGPFHMVFTPEAGQDYDTYMKFKNNMCQGLELGKFVRGTDGGIHTKPPQIHYVPFQSCK